GRVERNDGRSFREAVTLPESDTHGAEPARGVDAERRAAGDKDAHAAPEGFAHFGVGQLVGELPHERVGLAAVVDDIGIARTEVHGPREKTLFDGGLRRTALHLLVDFLENARYADDDRGPDIAHGLRQLVELRTVSHLGAVVVHHVIQRAGRDVREWQERDAGVGG